MLDTKYALKYHMPHSVVHIVDNSMYTGEIVSTVADDPSLYATIVVSGSPIGQDRTLVKLDRADIAAGAFGLANLTTDDIKKYGQSVTYPMSLLTESQTPVRFMRITPEDATYAFKTICVQWRFEESSGNEKMHVRFKQVDRPVGIRYELFKNTDRLNAALIANTSTTYTDDETGEVWEQRVFMNVISAGRGSIYNNMAFMVDLGSQSRRPANCRYLFTTYDTTKSAAVERFSASLINTNINNYNAIDSVNVVVKKRVPGSSILVPYVNESAVSEVFTEYMAFFKRMINLGIVDEGLTDVVQERMYAMLNVNIFDIVYGNYIYNTDVNYKLPFYQVDMLDTDIAQLPESHRITYGPKETINRDELINTVYDNKLNKNTIGVFAEGGSTYVGDVYLSPYGSSNIYPTINVIAAINQYSGAVTYVPFTKFCMFDDEGNLVTDPNQDNFETGEVIGYVNDVTVSEFADWYDASAVATALGESFNDRASQIYKMYKKSYLLPETKSIIAIVHPDMEGDASFDLYQVVMTTSDEGVTASFTVVPYATYTPGNDDEPGVVTTKLYQAIYWSSVNGVGNIIGYTDTTDAYKRVGYLVIDENGVPKINSYPVAGSTEPTQAVIGPSGVAPSTRQKFGATPTLINIVESMVGQEYDVMAYENNDIKTATITSNSVVIKSAGTGYQADDVISIPALPGAKLKVTSVDTNGEVTGLEVTTSQIKYTESAPYSAETENLATTADGESAGTGLTIDVIVKPALGVPESIDRFVVSGTIGSLFKVVPSPEVILDNYYSDDLGLNLSTEAGGVQLEFGSTGFFDDPTISDIEFKWRYQALLVKAFKGELDPRIKSVTRCPAKFLFDGGTNTILGMNIVPNVAYTPADIINASTIFTDDEKDAIIYNPAIISNLSYEDIDVKQAMYDLMVYRCFQGMREEMRPEGPGYGLELYLDSGNVDFTTAQLMNTSFSKRFTNPNASWDIGGYIAASDGLPYTFTNWIAKHLFQHCKANSINKPFAESFSAIPSTEYTSFFPDLDASDWDLRELIYNSGGNGWIQDINGNLIRKSQRTMYSYAETSDLVQESNMRTLSQFCYMLQNKIDGRLLDYSEDGVLRTLKDECDNMFSNWRGNLVQDYELEFRRDINPTDGADVIVCDATLIFRGLILRAAIVVNVQRRSSTT